MKVTNGALRAYEQAFQSGIKPAQVITGIQARFCREEAGNPLALVAKKDRARNRRIIFLVNAETAHDLIGVSGYQMARGVGWDHDYTKQRVAEGYHFGVVVFAESACTQATWDNLIDMVVAMYPEIGAKIAKQRAALRGMTPATLRDMEKRQGWTFLSVDTAGASDPRFMTIDRYRAAPDTADAARAFLYFTVHCKELYGGRGLAVNAQGQETVPEYIMPDRPLSDLGDHIVLPVTVTIPSVPVLLRAPVKGELPMPEFFDPENAALWTYCPKLQSQGPGDAPGLADRAEEWRNKHGVKPAAMDAEENMLLVIDDQKDFVHPNGSLYVGGDTGNGAIEDCARTAAWIYRNMRSLTSIAATMDTHFAHQIFFPSFWVDGNGKPLRPHRVVTTAQIRSGEVAPNPAVAKLACGGNYPWLLKQVAHYTAALEKAGKYELYLWPPHCILGSEGHALSGVLFEAIAFWEYVRAANAHREVKGGNVLTENYSVLAPEVLDRHDGKVLAQRNTGFIRALLGCSRLFIAGQASSHCVKSTIDDILAEIAATDMALARKVYLLSDCMSHVNVPGGRNFRPEADAALARFKAAGMHVITSETPLTDLPR